MKKPIIAIDIDDVLANNAKAFVEYTNQKWGMSLSPSDYDEHWSKVWQVDNEETERRATEFHESGVMSLYEHDRTAFEVLSNLRRDYKLTILTSRRIQTKEITIEWISKYYGDIFDSESIYFSGIWEKIHDRSIHQTKTEKATEIGVDFLIDDQLKHCLSFAESGKNAVLFGDYSWNQIDQLPNNVMRCVDWKAVEEYFATKS